MLPNQWDGFSDYVSAAHEICMCLHRRISQAFFSAFKALDASANEHGIPCDGNVILKQTRDTARILRAKIANRAQTKSNKSSSSSPSSCVSVIKVPGP
jgi:hypothetical protein